MKTFIKITGICLLLTLVSLSIQAQTFNNKSIEGNGIMVTRSLKTSDYNSINVRGSMEVTLVKGQEGNISVEAEENVQDYVLIESNGGVLTVGFKNNTSLLNVKKIKVTIPFEDLSEINVSGSSTVVSQSVVDANKLIIGLKGSGNITLNVKATKLDIDLGGSGKIELMGSAKDFKIDSKGSGKLDAEYLLCENVDASISGSGRATVHAKNNLKTRIKGSGVVKYAGNPANKDVKAFGSGETVAL